MSFRRVLALVLGSVAVHLAVVACGSADGPIFGQADPDAGAAGAGGGAGPEPTVAVEACDRVSDESIPRHFAAHSYPGESAEALSRVRVVARYNGANAGQLPGFDHVTLVPNIRDGEVAVVCGKETVYAESVTFIY